MKIIGLLGLCLIASAALSATKTSTTTTISSSKNPSLYGQSVIFTAAVSPQPPNGENVTFKQGSTVLGNSTLSGGKATFTISTLKTGGTDSIKATYVGDSNFASSTSVVLSQVVDQASTTTKLVPSQNPINVGMPVTFTATVTPQFSQTVTGNVAFYNGTKKLGSIALSSGSASYKTTSLPEGNESITATYMGNTSFTTSTSGTVNQTVGTGTTLNKTMVWDGVTRYYQVFVPTVLPANPALLLMLHGTAFQVPPANPSTESWGWQTLADQYQFIEVQPASTYNSKTGQWNWNSYFMNAAFQTVPDDVGFLRQLIINLTAQYNINPKTVFVTGMSSGAQMTERVGVEISDLIAAIAPASGQMEGQQAAPPPVDAPGPAVAPISVQEWHGTTDTELPPCNYGKTVYSAVTYYLDTVDDTFNYWVQQNSCSQLQTTQTLCTDDQPTAGLSGNIATSCVNSSIEVQFIWESGVGHSYVSKNNAARWQFLSAHAKQ